jgi:anhydro-N-acetylmuramic acid kinase
MKSPGHRPDMRISRHQSSVTRESHSVRHFIGLHLGAATMTISGALVRVWGRGLQAVADVVARSCCRDLRLGLLRGRSTTDDNIPPSVNRQYSAELAELAAQVVTPLTHRLASDGSSLRALGLLDFGIWHSDPYGSAFTSCVDATLLAKLTGISVVDDFPTRDLIHGGRGGPCEAAGAWLLMSDRGILPGRMIRALVDIDHTLRLFLLPPRQDVQLPTQLVCYELGPGTSLLDGIRQQLTSKPRQFDARDNLAVQGRSWPELMSRWRALLGDLPRPWTPSGFDVEPLLEAIGQPSPREKTQLADVLCTAVHLLADQVSVCVKQHLPRALPAGQLVVAGPLSQHGFLLRQIKTQVPELEVISIQNHVAATDSWRAVAAALLGMLHVDQIPMNSPSLTGADGPRVLGRLTPGSPANWHHVLADMASTLPDKMTLRSAV